MTASPRDLPRRLGAVSAAATLVGIMIGSGIFRVPSSVAARLPSPGGFLLVWLVGGLFALAGALALGELSGMFPESGGRYVFIREGVGPLPAFLYGWLSLFILRPASKGAIALVFASYLGTFVPAVAAHEQLTAAALIVLLGAVNYRSVLWSAGLSTVTSAAKALGLAGIAVAILVAAPHPAAGAPAAPAAAIGWHGFGLALVTVMWTYSGWGNTTYLAGEVRNAGRTMPLVLAGGVLGMIVLYMLVNAAFLRALPMAELTATKTVAADAAGKVFGSASGRLIGVLVLVSALGSLNSAMLLSARLPFAMGKDTAALGRLSAVHRLYQTPHVAVAVMTVLSVIYLSSHTFEQLAETFILGSWPFYILCIIGLFRLRRRRPDLARPFRTPGYPVVPALFLLASVGMLANAVVDRPWDALIAVGLALLGLPFYYGLRWVRPRAAATPPAG